MAATDALHISFDDGFGTIGNLWNVDASVSGEVTLSGYSAMMEWAVGREAGHGYGTYTINAKAEGNEPGPAIIFWPGDNQWPGQEIDLLEITPDGSGRQYGTLHWNEGGHDAYEAVVYDGVQGGVFHDYTMIWEAGRITFQVDGVEKAVFTDNVPTDFAHGGMNNTIGFLNNNPDTSITVRDVTYTPLGGAAPAQPAAPAVEPTPDIEVVTGEEQSWDDYAYEPTEPQDTWTPEPQAGWTPEPQAGWTPEPEGDPRFQPGPDGVIDWDALAAKVMANYEATGSWFV
ncbi:family 16 glycosylhydrolase [Roseomonas stagni]|uniref:Family 16 glycosylhydrolase n=1 Tax=Falsiroseomonas algicola TaxID=2716930 RepID=A0A6M1LGG4_9PROT|nr:family 16 glycosylhydrolase [Falsiroseomonas algicola]NGM19247.1 family 16 glycosylhydrolase [Falsiroseomonas algicola]